jgi:putative SOS response-associated peptidase YedK
MCGRAALTTTPEDLRGALGLDETPELAPRYNIHPSQLVSVMRAQGRLELLRWGLVPAWAKDTKIGQKLALARLETIGSKPAFREAVRHRRCLVIVSGFYEWHRAGTKTSTPFLFRRSDEKAFALAGVWERWVSRDGEIVESCAIVTQAARPPVQAVHDRMPVMLEREAWERWLDPTVSLTGATGGSDHSELVALAVGSHVNDPRNDDSECMRAAGEPMQRGLFASAPSRPSN